MIRLLIIVSFWAFPRYAALQLSGGGLFAVSALAFARAGPEESGPPLLSLMRREGIMQVTVTFFE